MTARSKQPPSEQAPCTRPESAGPQPARPGNFPVRTCVGCKERAVKSSLLRLVAVGNDLVPDPQSRRPGRGAYLHPSLACLDRARRRRAFSRALRVTRPLGTDPLFSYLSQDEAAAGDTPTCTESRSRS
ncbi:MAG: YlxR family protein [Streptosporangiales bacterium]|nr:YlxR family protein [Streptosporangiales bacterium]